MYISSLAASPPNLMILWASIIQRVIVHSNFDSSPLFIASLLSRRSPKRWVWYLKHMDSLHHIFWPVRVCFLLFPPYLLSSVLRNVTDSPTIPGDGEVETLSPRGRALLNWTGLGSGQDQDQGEERDQSPYGMFWTSIRGAT